MINEINREDFLPVYFFFDIHHFDHIGTNL